MSFDQIVKAVDDGIGNTLKGIALLVGLGSMFGSILEISGGAKTLAVTMVDRFGDRKAAWALAITGLVIAIPVFFDAGLIILIPLAFSLARRTGRSTLYYSTPLLAGLAVGHAFIPPTPGPVLVATMLGGADAFYSLGSSNSSLTLVVLSTGRVKTMPRPSVDRPQFL